MHNVHLKNGWKSFDYFFCSQSDVNLIFVTNKGFIRSVWNYDFKIFLKINKTKDTLLKKINQLTDTPCSKWSLQWRLSLRFHQNFSRFRLKSTLKFQFFTWVTTKSFTLMLLSKLKFKTIPEFKHIWNIP